MEDKQNKPVENQPVQEVQVAAAENPANLPTEGHLTFKEDVIAKITAIIAQDIPGLLSMSGNFLSSMKQAFGQSNLTKGITVEIVDDKAVELGLEIILEYNQSAPKVLEELKNRIGKQLDFMTGMKLTEINVRVVDTMSREEFEGKDGKAKKEEAIPAQEVKATIEGPAVDAKP